MKVLLEYESKSSPGEFHEVRLGDDGVIYCTCWAWKKKRTCKHLEDYFSCLKTKKINLIKEKNPLQAAIQEAVEMMKGSQ